eukprot:CAMPEP_0175975990 /NCGR_PEP_ID=MMETSP0108-20121206/44272_1 /TAXON_ID=195067 ORGANISM="Goniomonas pacifica, Strain CCMP1869" /NCGR_SAMPLE_ID=MMETSP0108 /ASSEMBLY_ACC=CAM_ASM_000204 /LENGTH=122 /DNA_ID=CAMNT_0017305841 /DNA_START=68 /DNA_END=436 /DNA_ORIENTATION=+
MWDSVTRLSDDLRLCQFVCSGALPIHVGVHTSPAGLSCLENGDPSFIHPTFLASFECNDQFFRNAQVVQGGREGGCIGHCMIGSVEVKPGDGVGGVPTTVAPNAAWVTVTHGHPSHGLCFEN